MKIANPIYDSVFKYLMSDSRIAKMLLSAIIGEKIIELNFKPKDSVYNKEYDEETKKEVNIAFFYLDFNAKIETETGEHKTIIIELQKKKRATDIMRFRQYLGTMFQSKENTYNKERVRACQIYCIYFLNYDIGLSDCPIIKVDNRISDLATGEELHGKSEFIESLNHLSWIVQIKYLNKLKHLKERHRTELEDLLSIFDQDNKTSNDHIIEIDEDIFPEKYRPIIRKLQEACVSQELKENMLKEDNYETEIGIKDKIIARKEKEIEKEKEESRKKEEEIERQREENRKKDEEIERQREENRKKDELIARLLNEKNK